MQFDVYPNPVTRARRAFPLVAVLQADIADTGSDRIVAFLAPRDKLAQVTGRMLPPVSVDGDEFVLLVPSLTTLPAADLRKPVGNIGERRDGIVAAIDWLFLGV